MEEPSKTQYTTALDVYPATTIAAVVLLICILGTVVNFFRNHRTLLQLSNIFELFKTVPRTVIKYYEKKFGHNQDVRETLSTREVKYLCRGVSLQGKVLHKIERVNTKVKQLQEMILAYRPNQLRSESRYPSGCSCQACQTGLKTSGFTSKYEP